MATTGLQWVMATGLGKPAGEDRKIIRSHVMRGKNRRKRGTERSGRDGDPERAGAGSSKSGGSAEASSRKAHRAAEKHRQIGDQKDGDDDDQALVLPEPTRIGSGTGLEFIRFAERVDPRMMDQLFKYLTVFTEAIYPASYCLPETPMTVTWVNCLGTDPAYLHCAVFSSQAWTETVRFRNSPAYLTERAERADSPGSPGSDDSDTDVYSHLSEATSTALTRTLVHLQTSIKNPQKAPTMGTILVITSLIISATILGDDAIGRQHLGGLRTVVDMAGGIHGIGWDLRRKVCRADLGHTLSTGDALVFGHHGGRWASARRGLERLTGGELDQGEEDEVLSLGDLWQEMKALSRLINASLPASRKVPARIFHDSMVSTLYRLLDLGRSTRRNSITEDASSSNDAFFALSPWFDPLSPLYNVLRLAVLAFAYSIWVDVSSLPSFCPNLSQDLRNALEFMVINKLASEDAKMWTLMMAGVSVLRDDKWVVEQLSRYVAVRDWAEVRELVKKDWLWVDGIHDEFGKTLFQKAKRWKVDALSDDWYRFEGFQEI